MFSIAYLKVHLFNNNYSYSYGFCDGTMELVLRVFVVLTKMFPEHKSREKWFSQNVTTT